MMNQEHYLDLLALRLDPRTPRGDHHRSFFYSPVPLTVNSTRLDKRLPSLVQIAPSASHSSVVGRVMMTAPSPSGATVMRQRVLLPFVIRSALLTVAPSTVNAWFLRVL